MCFRNGLAGFQVQSQKQKNREAVPNVVIVKPCVDDEHPTNKRSTSIGSHIVHVTSRERGKVAVYKSYCFVFLYQV